MAEAYAEDGFFAVKPTDDFEQITCLARHGGAGGKHEEVEWCLRDGLWVGGVAKDSDLATELAEKVRKVVSERVEVVEEEDVHNVILSH